jgi:hypothetical protein
VVVEILVVVAGLEVTEPELRLQLLLVMLMSSVLVLVEQGERLT